MDTMKWSRLRVDSVCDHRLLYKTVGTLADCGLTCSLGRHKRGCGFRLWQNHQLLRHAKPEPTAEVSTHSVPGSRAGVCFTVALSACSNVNAGSSGIVSCFGEDTGATADSFCEAVAKPFSDLKPLPCRLSFSAPRTLWARGATTNTSNSANVIHRHAWKQCQFPHSFQIVHVLQLSQVVHLHLVLIRKLLQHAVVSWKQSSKDTPGTSCS